MSLAMKKELTKKIAYDTLQEFFQNNKPFILFGTGASCAVDAGFGMESLKNHLEFELPNKSLTKDQIIEWGSVLDNLKKGIDIESAMNSVRDELLIGNIIECTASLIVEKDRAFSYKIMSGKLKWPPATLFKCITDRLPETDRALHVATTNYDLLAEYAFENAQIPYTTGFIGGICRRLDWKQADSGMGYIEHIPKRKVINNIRKKRKHIRLYKVHGSINEFLIDSNLIENNSWINDVPEGVERVMITPGTSKYKKLHQIRSELLGEYDSAIENHSSFLFIGFGFNDVQLNNNALSRKLKSQQCPGIIITRDNNDRINSLLNESKSLWLVCKHHDSNNGSTRIFNSQYSDWLYLSDKQLWKTEIFTKEILGG